MTSRQWEEVKERFHDALKQPTEKRQSFLVEACADDIVRTEVARLLIQHDCSGAFLDQPAKAPSSPFTVQSGTIDDAVDESSSVTHGLPDLFQNTSNPENAEGSATLLAGRTVGAYRLIRELGRGGMGVVWLGERADGLLKRPVAIKIPHAGVYGRHFAERFQRERQILAGLTHPHIGRLYDAGLTDEGEPFLALEYVEGTELIRHCNSKQMPVRERLKLFLQVLSAVHHANAHLVIHRDLKPSNILVTADGQVKLLDFGVAKLILDGETDETDLTQRGGHPLTPRYASPEQMMSEPISIASDVYSLGVVLFELLTGGRPYKNKVDTQGSLEEAILAGDVQRPSLAVQNAAMAHGRKADVRKLSAALKGDLDSIIMKALARQPEQRYPTADAFSQDIERHLHGQAVLAQPESVLYRSRKFAGRHRLAIAAVTAVILALSIGLTTALWQARKAREQAQTAESVLAFMEGIFRANSSSQPDPVKARQTTARELLDIGDARLEKALDDVPVAKMRVLETLNDMYTDLDIYDKNIELGRKRVELAKSIYGPSDPAVVDALLDLTVFALNSDSPGEHERAVREAGEILDKRRDYTSQLRASLEGSLADSYDVVDFRKALAHAKESVRLTRALSPPDANIMQSSALYELEAGDYESAGRLAAEALVIAESDPKPDTSWIKKHIGEAYDGAEDLTAANQNFTSAREQSRRNFGAQGPTTQMVEFAYATFLAQTSRISQALTAGRSAYAATLNLSRQGVTAVLLPSGVSMYGGALIDYGRPEEGLEVLRQAEEMLGHRPTLYPMNPVVLKEERSDGFIETGRYREAEVLLTEAAGNQRRINREHTPGYNRNIILRAHLLRLTGRNDEALRVLADYQDIPVPAGRVSRSHLEKSTTLSEIRLSAGDFGAARALAKETLTTITNSPNRPYLAMWEARAALVSGRADLSDRKAHEALPLLERAVAIRTDLLDPASPALADAEIALSNCYLDLGRRKEASTLLVRAEAIHRLHAMLGEHYRKPLRDLEHRFRT
ncbi:MAG: serine/threonine-protein kinase [Bryobacteraceae bacterium]